MLEKVFSDEAFPKELRKYKKPCYTYFYNKVLRAAMELLERGDLRTVRHLVRVLCRHGYMDGEIDAD